MRATGSGGGRRAGASGAGVTSANDGQSPARQAKSCVHEDWWIWVFRPSSVSTGTTDRQVDLRPQSPHPSHTRSLIHTRWAGVGSLPRLRSRRSSVAQRSVCSSTVTPCDL